MRVGGSSWGRWLCLFALTAVWSAADASAQVPGTRSPGVQIWGRAVYDKVPVTEAGLVPDARWQEPIRSAVVEVLDGFSGTVVQTTATDEDGWFMASLPMSGNYTVRVLSMLATDEVSVADNTRASRIWDVSGAVRPGEPLTLHASDEQRVAGAFNILDAIRRANVLVRDLEPNLEIPPLAVFWSPFNSSDPERVGALPAGTGFDVGRGVALVLGDRLHDSDEFDDDVILHEYAHFLAVHFSAGDSLGGPHSPGDVLDPRVAWSEGWANFFSALVDGDHLYRDSRAPGEGNLEYDLESNFPGWVQPGYWSERTVHALLWDLVDEGEDLGEQVSVGLRPVWAAFRQLADDAFVYLPSFLDALVEGGAAEGPEIEQLTRLHFLDYSVGGVSPLGSFPREMGDDVVTGELDSWTDRRTNLAKSAHLYAFHTSGGAVTIDLTVTGLGAARNRDANDLALHLMDADGRLLAVANGGSDGMAERISTFLPEGAYVVEVRSFFSRTPGGRDLNSASYRLEVSRP